MTRLPACTCMHITAQTIGLLDSWARLVIVRIEIQTTHLDRNQTPLHKAAWYEYYNVCKTLVDCGASVLTKDYKVSHCVVTLCRCKECEWNCEDALIILLHV